MAQLTIDGGKTKVRCTRVLKSALKRGENESIRGFDGCERAYTEGKFMEVVSGIGNISTG